MGRKVFLSLLLAGLAQVFMVGSAAAAPPSTEPAYANGQLVNISTPNNSHNTGKNTAQPFYLMVWTGAEPGGACAADNGQPVPTPDPCGPISPINGFTPNCNPCHHFGTISPLDYHDHILAGAPGAGVNGTAWAYNPMWHVYLVLYNPAFVFGGSFAPFTTDESMLDATTSSSAASKFLPVAFLAGMAPGGPTSNPYIWDTGIVFQCNVVSFHAA